MCITVQAISKIAVTWVPRKPLLSHSYGGGFPQVGRYPPSLLQHTLHTSENKVERKKREYHIGFIFFLWIVLFLNPFVASDTLPPGCCIILHRVVPNNYGIVQSYYIYIPSVLMCQKSLKATKKEEHTEH